MFSGLSITAVVATAKLIAKPIALTTLLHAYWQAKMGY
jgi:hypothetical protein